MKGGSFTEAVRPDRAVRAVRPDRAAEHIQRSRRAAVRGLRFLDVASVVAFDGVQTLSEWDAVALEGTAGLVDLGVIDLGGGG